MAKKKTGKNEIDMDFDDLDDLGDFDDDLQIDGMDSVDDENRSPSRSKVVGELAKEAGTGAFDAAIKNTAKKALPEEYSANYYEAMDVANFTKEVVDRNKTVLNKSMYKLGKEVKKLLPFKVGLLDDYIEKQEGDFETQRTQSEDEIRDTAVKSELTGIFDRQLDVQKAIEAKHDAEGEVDKKERLIQNKMSQDVLISIDSNIANQTAFTTQISKEYYRRSLELQFKSYYVQSDMLRIMRDHYKAFSVQFTNIEKNTSLPDFVKLRSTEKLKDIMREQTAQSVYKQMFSESKYFETVKKRIGGLVDGKVRDVTEMMDSATDMIGNMASGAESMGTSTAGLMGTVGAGMLGDTAGNAASDKFLVGRLKDKIKDNKPINAFGKYLGMLGTSKSALMETMKGNVQRSNEENADEGSPTRWLKSKLGGIAGTLLDVGTPGAEKHEIKNEGYLGNSRPAVFDNRVHRSIVEVIPMYLARILKDTTDLSAKYTIVRPNAVSNSTVLNYDFKNRKLDTIGNIKTNIQNELFKTKGKTNKSKKVAEGILSETSKRVDSDEGMTKKEKLEAKKGFGNKTNNKLLSDYIEAATNVEGAKLSYDDLITNYEDNTDKVKLLVAGNIPLKKLLENMKKHKIEDTQHVNGRISDISVTYPISSIKEAFLTLSKLARNPTPHVISDEVATVFAKEFSAYMLRTGKAVVGDTILSKEGIRLPKDVTDDVKTSMSALIADCIKIRNVGDVDIIATMNYLFATITASLQSNQSVDPNVFKEINELIPGVVGEGELGTEQLFEGILGTIDNNKEYLDPAEMAEIRRMSGVELNLARENQNARTALDSLVENFKKKHKGFSDKFVPMLKNDPSAALDLIRDELSKAKTVAGEKIRKNITELQGSLSSAFGIEQLTSGEGFQATAVVKVIEQIDKAITKMKEQKVLIEADIEERKRNLEAVGNTASGISNINSGAVVNETGKMTKALDKKKVELVKVLDVVVSTLEKQKKVLEQQLDLMRSGAPTTAQESLTRLMTTLRTGVSDIKAALKKYEDAGAELGIVPPEVT